MRLFKVGTILQIIYLVCCTFVFVCMPLYSAFYTTTFGLVCFKIGAVLTFVSTFNPVGLIGSILNIVACAKSNLKKSKKHSIYLGNTISNVVPTSTLLVTIIRPL